MATKGRRRSMLDREHDPVKDGQKERTIAQPKGTTVKPATAGAEEKKQLNVRVPRSLYKTLQREALDADTSLQEYIIGIIEQR